MEYISHRIIYKVHGLWLLDPREFKYVEQVNRNSNIYKTYKIIYMSPTDIQVYLTELNEALNNKYWLMYMLATVILMISVMAFVSHIKPMIGM